MALDLDTGKIQTNVPLGNAFPTIPENDTTQPDVEKVHDACRQLKGMLGKTSEATVTLLENLRDQMNSGEMTPQEALEQAKKFLGVAQPLMKGIAGDIDDLGDGLESKGYPRGPCTAPQIPIQ